MTIWPWLRQKDPRGRNLTVYTRGRGASCFNKMAASHLLLALLVVLCLLSISGTDASVSINQFRSAGVTFRWGRRTEKVFSYVSISWPKVHVQRVPWYFRPPTHLTPGICRVYLQSESLSGLFLCSSYWFGIPIPQPVLRPWLGRLMSETSPILW